IEITKHKFSRPTLTVPTGTTVTWLNRDEDVHTVVSTTLAFKSAGLETDSAYSYRFTKPGGYEYFCTLHPLMTGKVIVKCSLTMRQEHAMNGDWLTLVARTGTAWIAAASSSAWPGRARGLSGRSPVASHRLASWAWPPPTSRRSASGSFRSATRTSA